MAKRIVGGMVGVPNPQSDWKQTDPKKADYIKNKPDIEAKADKEQVENMYADLQFIIDDKIANIDLTTDDKLSATSTNPVQNKVITAELNKKANKEFAFDGVIKLEKFDEEHIGSLVDENSFVDGCAIYKVILESNKDMAILFVSRDAVYDVQGDLQGYMACEVLWNGVDSYITHYDEYSYIECEWQKVSVSQSDLNTAIGDIETSLENIIKKYGLGGDGV